MERKIDAARRRAEAKKSVKREEGRNEGHTEDPKAVAAAGGKKPRGSTSQPPFSANEKARLVHCIASIEFRPCVEVMLRGVTERVGIDDKLNRVNPFKELAILFNDDDMVFDNFFVDHAHGDNEPAGLDPNNFIERTDMFLKGEYINS